MKIQYFDAVEKRIRYETRLIEWSTMNDDSDEKKCDPYDDNLSSCMVSSDALDADTLMYILQRQDNGDDEDASIEKRLPCESSSSHLPLRLCTYADLKQYVHHFLTTTKKILVRGNVFELTPMELHQRMDNFNIRCHDGDNDNNTNINNNDAYMHEPYVAGCRISNEKPNLACGVAMPHTSTLTPRCIESHSRDAAEAVIAEASMIAPTSNIIDSDLFVSLDTGDGRGFNRIDFLETPPPPVRIVYLVHDPLVIADTITSNINHVAREKKRVTCDALRHYHQSLSSIDTQPQQPHSIILTELNPISTQPFESDSRFSKYARLCHASIEHALSYHTDSILIFGRIARERVLEFVTSRSKLGEFTEVEIGSEHGIRRVRFKRNMRSAYYNNNTSPSSSAAATPSSAHSLRTTIWFAPHPNCPRLAHITQRAIACAHGMALPPLQDTIDEVSDPFHRIEKWNRLTHNDGRPYKVTNIEISSSHENEKRFILANGIVTHNSTARFYAAGIVLAFEFMHSKGIIYRGTT